VSAIQQPGISVQPLWAERGGARAVVLPQGSNATDRSSGQSRLEICWLPATRVDEAVVDKV